MMERSGTSARSFSCSDVGIRLATLQSFILTTKTRRTAVLVHRESRGHEERQRLDYDSRIKFFSMGACRLWSQSHNQTKIFRFVFLRAPFVFFVSSW